MANHIQHHSRCNRNYKRAVGCTILVRFEARVVRMKMRDDNVFSVKFSAVTGAENAKRCRCIAILAFYKLLLCIHFIEMFPNFWVKK